MTSVTICTKCLFGGGCATLLQAGATPQNGPKHPGDSGEKSGRPIEAVDEPQIHALRRRFSNSTLDEIVAAYQAGESALSLGERYGISGSTVLVLLHERGVEVRIGKLQAGDAQGIVELYLAGQTQRAVADQFGITRTAVMHILRKQGVSLPKRTPRG